MTEPKEYPVARIYGPSWYGLARYQIEIEGPEGHFDIDVAFTAKGAKRLAKKNLMWAKHRMAVESNPFLVLGSEDV